MTPELITLYSSFSDILSKKLDGMISTEDFTLQIRSLRTEIMKAVDAEMVTTPSEERDHRIEQLETLAKKVIKYV